MLLFTCVRGFQCWIFTARRNANAVLTLKILSVCHMLTYCRYFDVIWNCNHSSFLTPTMVVGRPPFSAICCMKLPISLKNVHFDISAHRDTRNSEKVWLSLTGNRPRTFQQTQDKQCLLTLSPPAGGSKHRFAFFCEYNSMSVKHGSYKVSLYEIEAKSF